MAMVGSGLHRGLGESNAGRLEGVQPVEERLVVAGRGGHGVMRWVKCMFVDDEHQYA